MASCLRGGGEGAAGAARGRGARRWEGGGHRRWRCCGGASAGSEGGSDGGGGLDATGMPAGRRLSEAEVAEVWRRTSLLLLEPSADPLVSPPPAAPPALPVRSSPPLSTHLTPQPAPPHPSTPDATSQALDPPPLPSLCLGPQLCRRLDCCSAPEPHCSSVYTQRIPHNQTQLTLLLYGQLSSSAAPALSASRRWSLPLWEGGTGSLQTVTPEREGKVVRRKSMVAVLGWGGKGSGGGGSGLTSVPPAAGAGARRGSIQVVVLPGEPGEASPAVQGVGASSAVTEADQSVTFRRDRR